MVAQRNRHRKQRDHRRLSALRMVQDEGKSMEQNVSPSQDLAQSANRLDNGRADGAGKLRARNRGQKMDGPSGDRGTVDAPAASDGGGVEVADSPARAAPWDATASLRVRLLRAQIDVATLGLDATIKVPTKSGGEASYKGIKAEQVIAKAKQVLLKHGVLYTSEALTERIISGNKTSVYLRGYFENVDDPADCIVRHAWGDGTDNNDKGTAKATTNANKILLVRTLNMNTQEYEEAEAVEHEPERKPNAVRNAEALTDTTIKAWADTYKRALDGCKSSAELGQLRADNAHMMKHPGVPQITKDYFVDKITALESILE